jgi:hypothetical protein
MDACFSNEVVRAAKEFPAACCCVAQEIHPSKNRPALVLQVEEAAGDAVESVVRVVCTLKMVKK